MKYIKPLNETDPAASYVDMDEALGIEGSDVPAKAIEHPMREIEAVIVAAGLDPDENDLTQLAQAISANRIHPLGILSDVNVAGISLGQILKFDGTKFVPFSLPAIDAETRNLAMTAFIKANILSTDPAGKQGNVIADDFKADSLATKTGAYFTTGNYSSGIVGDLSGLGTVVGSGFNYPENCFNDGLDASTWSPTTANNTGAIGAYVGINFGAVTSIDTVRFYRDTITGPTSVKIKTSADGVTWTDALTVSGLTSAGWVSIDTTAVVGDAFWALQVNSGRQDNTNSPVVIYEIEFVGTSVDNMLLKSAPVQLDTADPTDISVYFLVTDTDTVIDGTDRVVSISIDGGTTFATATFTSSWTYEAGKRLVRFDADISGQAGDQLVWKMETFNTKLQTIEHFSALPVNYG